MASNSASDALTDHPDRKRLIGDDALERSAVVANCAMNRERQLTGVNSYARELGFDPIEFLSAQVGDRPAQRAVGWLDLCCGTGRALIQAGARLAGLGLDEQVELTGIDLVDYFDPAPAAASAPSLVVASVATWHPGRAFDLITCVHGLHYVGDKLAVLTRAASWLTPEGRFVADLDLRSILIDGGQAASRRLATRLRGAGYAYDARRHRITRTGRAEISLPYAYLGADDRAGPRYTGQPAVDSYYREVGNPTGPARSQVQL